ncbi:MAG: outer membrane lipoprotein-sorting protein [Deltaproteobacteria bacterium]|nr:outer membrane lipoprotein-sorting protein [Deltaproteobacteria bacterium]
MKHQFLKNYLILSGWLFLFSLGFFVSVGQTQMSPKEVLQKADEARGNAQGIQWDIKIESMEAGREQVRTIRVTARGYHSLAETLYPANVKGQRLLMIDRNMWFAKPGLSKPVPISPRQKLMGMVSNGDVASTNYSGDYNITQTADVQFNGETCYLFDLKALDSRATYDRIKYWISKKRLVGLQAEFYTVSGKMFKTATFEYQNSIALEGREREFISRMTVNSAIVKEDVTTMSYQKPILKKVPDAFFNLNLLMK